MIELIVGLPQGVLAVFIQLDEARMLLLAQDGQHEIIMTGLERAGLLDRPGLAVITRR